MYLSSGVWRVAAKKALSGEVAVAVSGGSALAVSVESKNASSRVFTRREERRTLNYAKRRGGGAGPEGVAYFRRGHRALELVAS